MQSLLALQGRFVSKQQENIKEDSKALQKDQILKEIQEVVNNLKNIRSRFEFETSEDMIEYCIYKEKALLSEYKHLLSLAKCEKITCTPISYLEYSNMK